MIGRKLYRLHVLAMITSISIEVQRVIFPIILFTFVKRSLTVRLRNLLIIFIVLILGLLSSLSNQTYTPFIDAIKIIIGIVTFFLFYKLYFNTDLNKITIFVLFVQITGLLIEYYFIGTTRPSFLFYEPGYVAPLICLSILTSIFSNAEISSRLITVFFCGVLVLLTQSLFALGFFAIGSLLLLPIFSIAALFCIIVSLPLFENFVIFARIFEVIKSSSFYDVLYLMGNRLPRMTGALENLEFSVIPLGSDHYQFFEAGRRLPMTGIFFELSYILGVMPACMIVLFLVYICFRSVVVSRNMTLIILYSFLLFYSVFESIVFKYYIWACFGVINAASFRRKVING